MIGTHSLRRIRGLVGTSLVALTLTTAAAFALPGPAASASVASYSGTSLSVSSPLWDTCTYKPKWDYTPTLLGGSPVIDGADKTITVGGPTLSVPGTTGRTVYYQAIVTDLKSGAVIGRSQWSSAYVSGTSSYKFGTTTFSVPYSRTLPQHLVYLDTYAYDGSVQKAHVLIKTDHYKIYGLSGLWIADGSLSTAC